jgi:hypothetical protein
MFLQSLESTGQATLLSSHGMVMRLHGNEVAWHCINILAVGLYLGFDLTG